MFNINIFSEKMLKTFEVFTKELSSLRTGRANASMLGLASKLDSSALDDELASQLGAAASAAAALALSILHKKTRTFLCYRHLS